MKIEKISDNKFKIVLSKQDLLDKNIDIHSFNKNSFESQDLFFDILQEIEASYDFDLDESQLLIEGISTINGGMVLTVTKSIFKNDTFHNVGSVKVRKKAISMINEIIYCFDSLDNFTDFAQLFKTLSPKYKNSLYCINDKYYLVLINNTTTQKQLSIKATDFATIVSPFTTIAYLNEYGTLIVKNNAIQTFNKKFC